MINREIVYERNLTGSFMKIPVGIHAGLDEQLMLRRKLPGVLPVEKAYVDGNGQYWYNISGKQSLDTLCRVKEIGIDFIERLIISICSEMEILEWNLIHTSCLMLDPELVFITNCNGEFIFTIYPVSCGGVEMEFQQLMEYLLKRVDHKDALAVKAAYGIYEKTLQEGYSIMDIRDSVMEAKRAEPADSLYEKQIVRAETEGKEESEVSAEEEKHVPTGRRSRHEKAGKPAKKECKRSREWWQAVRRKLTEWGILEPETESGAQNFEKKRDTRSVNSKRKEPEADVVYPEEEMYVAPDPVIRPTVCLTNVQGKPRGVLMYQGSDQLADIRIRQGISRVGYDKEAEIQIERDTISQFHARIDREEDTYYIEDLNSTNGTFVNEEPLAYKERRKLSSNDIVRFADVRYRFG